MAHKDSMVAIFLLTLGLAMLIFGAGLILVNLDVLSVDRALQNLIAVMGGSGILVAGTILIATSSILFAARSRLQHEASS